MGRPRPQALKGFRDFLPGDIIAREKVIRTIKEVYESYGFSPLATPAMEEMSTLLGYGDEANKQIYTFRDPDGNQVGLRYDLTVPLARVVAQYRDLPRPFKRYQVQPVWRYDKPDPGRFREFMQFDVDTVGTASVMADAEIILVMAECLDRLGLDARIRFSSRKVLNSLMAFAGIEPDLSHAVFRVMDKLEKQGLANVKLELGPGRVDASGDPIKGLGLGGAQIAKIEEFLKLPQSSRKEALASVTELFKGAEGADGGIDELRQISAYLDELAIPDSEAAVDLSIARGLDYYTGPVFEAILTDKKLARLGSIMGGGRYDDLIGGFVGEPVPATGASMGIDRLFSALEKAGKAHSRPSTTQVLVTVMMRGKMAVYGRLARQLRAEGLNTEVYMGKEGSIGKQLKYADRLAIPIAVIVGPDEEAAGTVSIKDLRAIETEGADIKDRKEWITKRIGQQAVPAADLANVIKSILR
jgi:histidyl-tRNA synthetase